MATLTLTATLLIDSPASAAPKDSEPTKARVHTFGEDALKAATRPATSARGDAAAQVKAHLDDSARRGKLVDKSRTSVVNLADPFNAGEQISVVWDGSKAPSRLTHSRMEATSGDGHADAIDLRMGDGDAASMPTSRSPSARTGSGFDGATLHTGAMYIEDNGCATYYQTPSYPYSGEKHKIVSCYEAWGLDGTPIWVYNRWSGFWRATPSCCVSTGTIDMEVSARPWAGYQNRIKQLADWRPRDYETDDTCDTDSTMTLSGAWQGISGSVTMPMNTCNQLWPNIIAGPGTLNQMTIDFDGVRTLKLLAMDIAAKYDAVDKYVLPIWADRNYIQIRICTTTTCGNPWWSTQDSGW